MRHQLTNALNADRFVFVLGRKRQLIKKPSRFETNTEVQTTTYLDIPVQIPVSQTYRLFVDDKLFASVIMPPKRKGLHTPIRFIRPRRGPLEIHFVKKYTILH